LDEIEPEKSGGAGDEGERHGALRSAPRHYRACAPPKQHRSCANAKTAPNRAPLPRNPARWTLLLLLFLLWRGGRPGRGLGRGGRLRLGGGRRRFLLGLGLFGLVDGAALDAGGAHALRNAEVLIAILELRELAARIHQAVHAGPGRMRLGVDV